MTEIKVEFRLKDTDVKSKLRFSKKSKEKDDLTKK